MLHPPKDLQDLVTVVRGGSPDDTVGDVKDLDFDARASGHLVVSADNRWKGRQVLPALQWNQLVSRTERSVRVGLTRETLNLAPGHNPASPLSRKGEITAFTFKHRRRAVTRPGVASVADAASDRTLFSRNA